MDLPSIQWQSAQPNAGTFYTSINTSTIHVFIKPLLVGIRVSWNTSVTIIKFEFFIFLLSDVM